jgi:uncharacterized protein (DUF111 family)
VTSTDTAHAWVDARNGVAGDMLLAALLDAGADFGAVTAAIEAVLPATVRLNVHEVQRAGLRALKLDVTPLVDDHHHRDWTTIRTLLTDAGLPQRVRHDALAGCTFTRWARGTPSPTWSGCAQRSPIWG